MTRRRSGAGSRRGDGACRCASAATRAVGQSSRPAPTMTMNFRADPVPRHGRSPAWSRSPTGCSSREARAADAREPWWIEYPKSFFPVLLIVFLLRSFVAEPFKIPSSSMRPTLEVGDFILVNKFAYGLRLPIIEQKIMPLADPQRGDVVVFRYPLNPSQDFIKRVDRRCRGDDGRLPGQAADGQRQALAAASRRHLQLSRGPALRDDGAVRRRPCRTTARTKEHSDRRQSACCRR